MGFSLEGTGIPEAYRERIADDRRRMARVQVVYFPPPPPDVCEDPGCRRRGNIATRGGLWCVQHSGIDFGTDADK